MAMPIYLAGYLKLRPRRGPWPAAFTFPLASYAYNLYDRWHLCAKGTMCRRRAPGHVHVALACLAPACLLGRMPALHCCAVNQVSVLASVQAKNPKTFIHQLCWLYYVMTDCMLQ